MTALSAAALGTLDARVGVPAYDRGRLVGSIVHLGVGNFVRAHLASYLDEVAQSGTTSWGIVGAGVRQHDRQIAATLAAQDHLYTLVQRGEDTADVRVIGSLLDHLAGGEPDRTEVRLAAPETRIVSLTITEAGYPIDADGHFDPASSQAGPDSAIAVVVRGLRLRHDAGQGPLTVLSCDNIVGNGDVTRAAVLGVAERLDTALAGWIERNVAFPNSMVDRITPATTDADRAWLASTHGIEDRWPVMTEPFRQWVLEDTFAADRPPLEQLDVLLTSDVRPYERMKLHLLNAAHSCLAYPAALLGFGRVDHAMADPLVERLVRCYLDTEGGPVVPPVPGIDLDAYRSTLVQRFRNPAVADQVSRLCQDGSAKLPTFVLPVVREQRTRQGPIGIAALAVASWCVYLAGGVGDIVTEPAPDPLLDTLSLHARAADDDPREFLRLRRVFGDLDRDERFVAAFLDAHRRLRDGGVRRAIEAAIDGSVAG
ncbi:mannitol dehydrogenase family protein [Egicoccus sp. AB-alg6-2]|uniref:mannitol dehydrogenase family protein n=1 Tax=Egicoccus sp. AB-alg6-2 TaxID=3242692 RepID=UPI00359F0F8D